jgi:hypothetical protein
VVEIALLAAAIVMIDHFDDSKINEQKEAVANMANLVRVKNNKIIILSKRLTEKQKECDALHKMLAK